MTKEWFDSFYRFEQQEASKWSYGNFDIRGLGLTGRGYMGQKFQNMGEGFQRKTIYQYFYSRYFENRVVR